MNLHFRKNFFIIFEKSKQKCFELNISKITFSTQSKSNDDFPLSSIQSSSSTELEPSINITSDPNSVKDLKTKLLKVAIIGVPNAGKSTFINNLINHRVCPTSNKVHTTRTSNAAINTINNTQLIFYDTPGLVTEREIKKHKLESSFQSSYRHSIQHGNIIGVIHDASNSWTRNELHSTVLSTLNFYPKLPSFLILNKIDSLKSKRILLELVRKLTNDTLCVNRKSGKIREKSKLLSSNLLKEENTNSKTDIKPIGWSNFSDVFMVSSVTGDGLQDVMNFLLRQAKPSEWEFSSDVYTDQTPEDLIVNSVRARLLDYLPQEIPYTLKSEIEYFSEENGTIYASVIVSCPTPRIEKLICGQSNGKLRQITERVTSDLLETFNKRISLTISTTSYKN